MIIERRQNLTKLLLVRTSSKDSRLLDRMESHYSKPKGFVGRSLCYAVIYNWRYYGHIVAGSATLNLPNRHKFLGTNKEQLNNIVNNIFFNISPWDKKYPLRNFSSLVVKTWMSRVIQDWKAIYGDEVKGFETLIEPPRTGELYLRAGFSHIGTTKGYTCKRTKGSSKSEKYTGVRVWDYENLRPKHVLAYRIKD